TTKEQLDRRRAPSGRARSPHPPGRQTYPVPSRGNYSRRSDDYLLMQCSTYRAAISARLDGEDIGLPAEVLDAHLAGCGDCQAWAAAADALAGAVARAPRSDVPLDPALLAALVSPPEPRPAPPGPPSTGEWRVVLGVIAVALFVVSWPGAFLTEGHASVHIAHQLTAWDMGLAAGFLVAALFPARAWGMLPLAGVLGACM